jgi:hypothetical protein
VGGSLRFPLFVLSRSPIYSTGICVHAHCKSDLCIVIVVPSRCGGRAARSSFLQVWGFDLASDGVEMSKFVSHSVQMFLARCKDAPDDLVCRKANVRAVMVIPGPKGPKKRLWAVYWWLVFKLFGVLHIHPMAPTFAMLPRLAEL